MSDRFSEDYLRDMAEAIELAIEFTDGMEFEEFTGNKKTIFAVTRAIQIIGEANYCLIFFSDRVLSSGKGRS